MSDLSPFRTGLACRCPACGKGKLFSGYLTVAQKCAACGLDLAAQDSGDGPAVFLVFIVGFVVTPLAVIAGLKTDWPLWLHLLLWGGLAMAMILVLLRPSKGLTIALQYRYRRQDGGAL